jgi:aminoglycoside phosphotransferase (APT) family kinase protein
MAEDSEEDKPWWQPPAAKFPSPDTLQWVAKAFGPGARVVGGRRLTGGLISSVHRLSVETRDGARRQVVLRQHLSAEAGERPAEWISREANVLQALEQTDVPAPRLLAIDPEGKASGFPALLMSRMPGSVYLAPNDADSWLKQTASMAARIHNISLKAELPNRRVRRSERQVPKWTGQPDLWREVIAVTAAAAPAYEPRFIHGDYQHFNLLWSRGRLTGVVDWGGGAFGHPDADTGHCRLNLAVLFSADYAERFRLAYEAEAGRKVEPWWDLRELMAYSPDWQEFIPIQVAGRVPVDTAGMTARVEELMGATLACL